MKVVAGMSEAWRARACLHGADKGLVYRLVLGYTLCRKNYNFCQEQRRKAMTRKRKSALTLSFE